MDERLKIDFKADAAYLRLAAPGGSIVWSDFVTDNVIVDVEGDEPVGIEVVGLQTDIPIGRLVREHDIPDWAIKLLLLLSGASLSVLPVGSPSTEQEANGRE